VDDWPARAAASVYCIYLSAFSLSLFSCIVITGGVVNLGMPGLRTLLVVSATIGILVCLNSSLLSLNDSRFFGNSGISFSPLLFLEMTC